ncbi:MAG TPA: single-stranded-DNA-specific exonuclease RecJ [Bryobacteraceae bacterium]|nr:single-stranded-DNA-specific exonuclease RecJ [Bryobacteraceae bacterium]
MPVEPITPPAANWLMPESDEPAAQRLVSALRLHPIAARVLLNRGFSDPAAAERFLAPSLAHLHNPLLLTGMSDAVARLRVAIQANEKILIYGDYDVDGTVSVVILKKAIELAGGHASYHVPHRLKDGYGMRSEMIDRAAAMGVHLIVSVDTGIRAQDVVRGARELGIDVIITDHHLPDAQLPPATAVLNPNRRDCSYPDKNLCGAGVAFKLVHALLETLGWPKEKLERMLKSFLKLVAIATVADVVPLLGENRVIVKYGLEGLNRAKNPGLRALLEVSGMLDGRPPGARQVAFQIAPRMNAAGRMDDAEKVIQMFLTEDPECAKALAVGLHSLNQERQQTEAEIVRLVLEECSKLPVAEEQAALVFAGDGWHRGVVGIVASRLVERFCRPVFVLSQDIGETQGSGRSIASFHLLDALESMPDLFTRFGGHKQAAGVSLSTDRVAEFRERLNAYAAARLTPADFRPQLGIDALVDLKELTSGPAVEQILAMAPFGFGNPAPVLAIRDAEIAAAPVPLKEKHLKLHLRQGGRNLLATAWNLAARAAEFTPGARADAAFTIEEDAYSESRGWGGWAATLKDVRLQPANLG